MDLRTAVWNLLAFGVFPAWLTAGGGDWLCHRRSGIEHRSGPTESWLHLLLYAEIAVPVILALFFEINALLLLVMTGGVAAHMMTSLWDTSYAQPRRHIAPIEQQVHSWLEMLPLFALALIVLLHWQAFEDARWTLHWRQGGMAPLVRTLILGGLSLGALIIIEEIWRGARSRSARPA